MGTYLLEFVKVFLYDNITILLICSFLFLSFSTFIIGRGCGRVVEVAQKFLLNTLPVKQMEIDNINTYDSTTKIVSKINKILIIVQLAVVLLLEVLYILHKIKIDVRYINNILVSSIITQEIILIIFIFFGKKIYQILKE